MEKDPKLKVTTAIKQIGFSDPSVIRRLRDKFKANRDVLLRCEGAASIREVINNRSGQRRSSDILRPQSTGRYNGQHQGPTSPVSVANKFDNRHPRSSVTDYIALGTRSFALMAGFQADMMRCLLQHPDTDLALKQRSAVYQAMAAGVSAEV